MKLLIIVFLLFPFIFIAAQEKKVSYPEPHPSWEIITSKIKYPDLAVRGGINNSYKVSFTIESLGTLTNLSIKSTTNNQALDSLFIIEISNVLNSISWDVGNINESPVSMNITMLMIFSTSTKTVNSSRKISQTNPYWVTSTVSVDSKSNIKIDSINVSH